MQIFGLFLNIRADERHRLGVIEIEEGREEEEIRFSVFATCNPKCVYFESLLIFYNFT